MSNIRGDSDELAFAWLYEFCMLVISIGGGGGTWVAPKGGKCEAFGAGGPAEGRGTLGA